MARSLLVAPTGSGADLARTCLGMVRALDRRGVKVAFVKPVAQPRPGGRPDQSAALAGVVADLHPPDPLSVADLEQLLGAGGLDLALEKVVAAWQSVHDSCDVVVVEGLSPDPPRLYATEFNQALARALDADVLLVARWPAEAQGGEESPVTVAEGLAEALAIAAAGYSSGEGERVAGCAVHNVPPDQATAGPQLHAALARRELRLLAAVPERPELSWFRVRDLVRELRPRFLSEGDLSRRIKDVAVFAQGCPAACEF